MSGSVPIDSQYHDAFCHWVFESAIFLPRIRAEGKKVALSEKKQYKLLFCEHLGFTEDDIDYTTIARNYTITLMDNPVPPEYAGLLRSFFTHFSSNVVPDVDFVLLPRQKKENYVANDRPCHLTPFLNVFRNSGRSYRIVNTDEITNLQTQIDLVNSGRIVIVTDGSPAIVNGMFCSGKRIYIVRTEGVAIEIQARIYPMMKLLLDHVCSRNTVSFIHGHEIYGILSRTRSG